MVLTQEFSMEASCTQGASPEAIQHHYDVGNDFYRLWLDPTLTYSCALWNDDDGDDMLEIAQRRKIEHHSQWAHAKGAERVLDIGCGWGAVLKHLVEEQSVRHAVGLTLSRQQAEWIGSFHHPGIEVRQESWMEHDPAEPYDAVISIGAFEHFARPEWDEEQKVAAYRDFFARCHRWLRPGGRLALQTIAYGDVDPAQVRTSSQVRFIVQEIFPESELPTLAQIIQACDGLFEVVALRNDRENYERTCRVWCSRLTAQRRQAVATAGADVVARYVRYLRLSAAAFQLGQTCLLRCAFRRFDSRRNWAVAGNKAA
jgi:cyclopropane-fatty-acyl-phospholipid synthase